MISVAADHLAAVLLLNLIVEIQFFNVRQFFVNANTIFAQTEFGISNTGSTIRVVFDETKNVSFVNSNTVLVDTNLTTTNNFVSIIVQKVR